MSTRFLPILAIFAFSAVAFAQFGQEAPYQIGYAANLNIGDSVVNISNSGIQGGFGLSGTPAHTTHGNICVNVYTFDPQEEEIACCSCLVTPNGLYGLSAKNDLINKTLTPAVPTSIVIKLVASEPATDTTGGYTICNASVLQPNNYANVPYDSTVPSGLADTGAGSLAVGLRAWGSTLEPAAGVATYAPVSVTFLNNSDLGGGTTGVFPFNEELVQLYTICRFIQVEGTGYGICGGCQVGALAGQKQ
ncbi:MAG: hypothetical protein ABSB35_24835 [Bryobacteraceae bacterium]|jgi:hypothetical protein